MIYFYDLVCIYMEFCQGCSFKKVIWINIREQQALKIRICLAFSVDFQKEISRKLDSHFSCLHIRGWRLGVGGTGLEFRTRQRQRGRWISQVETSLVYIVHSRPARTT